jgi:hypothetical protein
VYVFIIILYLFLLILRSSSRISGLFVFDGQTLPTLKCAWNVGTAVTLSDLTDATPTNKTYIACPAKTGLTVGAHEASQNNI